MVSTTPRPASEIELELPLDDPRLTPLVQRLATEYWQIVQRHAVQTGFPIVCAWLESYVDLEDVTCFPLTVHSDTSHAEARDFERNVIGPDVQHWSDQLDPAELQQSLRVILAIVGLKEPWIVRRDT